MRTLLVAVAIASALLVAAPASGGGGDYAFDGGTRRQQAEVRAALEASGFDWSVLPRRITVHIARGSDSYATPGEVWLDADLLDAGRFSWAVVQHEFAHQVDFLVLDGQQRARVQALVGGAVWSAAGVSHEAQASERFAETLAAVYWRSSDNVARAYAAPAAFRAALDGVLGRVEVAETAPAKAAKVRARRTSSARVRG